MAHCHRTSTDFQEPQPILTSEPVTWEVEYRCFVLNGQVEAISSYWRGDVSTRDEQVVYLSEPDEMEAARDLVTRVINSSKESGLGDRGAVVDVGLITGFGWAVIEANPAWGAGLYGCDPEKVLQVIASCVTLEP